MIHDVLILGAGLSGLKAARDLHAAGKSVLVLDKSRGVSGRASTRRWDGTPVDHGAQFFTARSEEFKAQVEDWKKRGVVFVWAHGFHQWDKEGGLKLPDADKEAGHPRHACHAGMSALGKDLAAGLPEGSVRTSTRAVALRWTDDHWQVSAEGTDETFAGRRLVSTLPTPQALALFEQSTQGPAAKSALDPFVLKKLQAVEMAPCLGVLLRGEAPAPEWQAIQLRDETVTWIGADSDRRGKPAADGKQVFVVHGSGPFSREWQDRSLDEAADILVARAGEIVGDWITRLPERQVNRWRYSSVPHGLENDAYLRNGALGEAAGGRPPVYFAGDTYLGSKVEGAWRSGYQVAKAILAEDDSGQVASSWVENQGKSVGSAD